MRRLHTAFLPLLLLVTMAGLPEAQASNRWELLNWCTQNAPEERARCDGLLLAAVDLRTSDDFSGAKSCFHPKTRLPDVREAVVAWLKENRTVPEQSGLALAARAIEETFPCAPAPIPQSGPATAR